MDCGGNGGRRVVKETIDPTRGPTTEVLVIGQGWQCASSHFDQQHFPSDTVLRSLPIANPCPHTAHTTTSPRNALPAEISEWRCAVTPAAYAIFARSHCNQARSHTAVGQGAPATAVQTCSTRPPVSIHQRASGTRTTIARWMHCCMKFISWTWSWSGPHHLARKPHRGRSCGDNK